MEFNMARRVNIKTGDIFRVPLNKGTYRYFQFIRINEQFLNLDLVRVYEYELDDLNKEQDECFLKNILQSRIMFYAYVDTIKLGVKVFKWEKISNVSLESDFTEPKFLSRELTNIADLDSYSWYLNSKNEKKLLGITLDVKYHNLPFQAGTNPKIMAEIMELGYDKYNFTQHYLNV